MKYIPLQKLRAITTILSGSSVVQFVRRHKRAIASLVLLLFFIFIAIYLTSHPDVPQSVLRLGYANAAVIILFYGGVILTNIGIMYTTIRLCRKKLPLKKGILLMIYSSVINFFGPLQSGPGVRAVYLKRTISLRIRDYTYAMLAYYLSFAAINVSLLFSNTLPWLSVLGIAATLILTIITMRALVPRALKKYVLFIFILTVIQVMVMVCIYSVELAAVTSSAHYSLFQTTAYTASANLALFVSLTPGAIGIREAFLVFSHSLHAIPLSSIVAAGIVDRAIYVVFLVLLFLVSSSLHLRDMFIGQKKL